MATNLQLSSMVHNLSTLQVHLARPLIVTETMFGSNSCNLTPKTRLSTACVFHRPNSTKKRVRLGASSYQPNIWDYEYLQLLETDHCDEYKYKIEMLVEEMRDILGNEAMEPLPMLHLIDKIQRFGLGYHFEEEIKKALEIRLISLQQLGKSGHDLHDVALSFRLLRQHGYHVPQDVLKNFKDNDGSFKEDLEEDVVGMLSLYEASHVGLEGGDILDEAITFTRTNLIKKMDEASMKMGKVLAERVSHSLEAPLHHRTHRHEARWSIEQAYNNDEDVKTKHPKLLELAMLDFNMVQLYHQRYLKDMAKWWKEMGLSSKLSFARDRLVESFFWAMGMTFDPQHSKCLKGLTKVAALVTTIDDVYDVYGTLDELETFTNVVKRWDVNDMDQLPSYMKLCFLALYNAVNEMAYDNLKVHEENVIPYLSKAWGDLCESFMQEAKWNSNKKIPRINEYMENSWLFSSGALFLIHAYIFMSESITKESLQCLLYEYNDFLRNPSLLFRLYNDLSTSKDELERGETTNSIVCYMNEHGVSEELAREKIRDLIEQTWKKMNEINRRNYIDNGPFSRAYIETVLNLGRIAHLTYQHGDAHGAPDTASKNRVKSLILDPISFS